MKRLFLLLAFFLPLISQAAITVPWTATSTDKGYISPALVNGNNPFLKVFSTGTSTFSNGINLLSGCFSINNVCVGGISSFNTRTGAITLTSSDVTTALGFTPFGNTNPLPVSNGGTSSTTLTGILIGNGASPVNTVTVGSGLSLTGTTLAATGGGTGTVGSGTTGQFPYYAANGTTLTATSSIFLGVQGNVGVGTTTPLSKLTVGGNATIGADYNIAAPTNGLIVEGRVGIGTSSPISLLDVATPLNTNGAIFHYASSSGQNTYPLSVVNSSGLTTFAVGANATADEGQLFLAAPVAQGSGAGINFTSGSGKTGLFQQDSAGDMVFRNNNAAGTFFDYNTGGLFFRNGGGSVVTLQSDGTHLGVGRASGAGASTLSVYDGTASTGQTQLLVQGGAVAGDATTNQLFRVNQGGGTTGLFVIQGSGNVGIGTTSPGSLLSVQGIANFTTGTSTFQSTGGINLANGGCFAIGGVCIGSSGGSGTVTSVATTYPVLGGTFTTSGTISLAFGTTTANTWSSLQTFTTPIVDGTLSGLISGNAGITYATATSTLTASSPLTGSFTQVGSGGSLGCQTASGSQAGCLSSTDWNTFNGKGSGTVTSIATNNGLTGGTITTTGTIGLATISANSILGNVTGASAVPTSLATTSLFSGTTGQFPYFSGTNTLTATSSLFTALSGFIGIGTTTPNDTLTVGGTGAFGINLDTNQSITTQSEPLFFSNATASQADSIFNLGGALTFSTLGAPGTSSGTQRMTLLSGGNFGIGTTTPFNLLSIGDKTLGNYGSIAVTENKLATTTSMTINWKLGNQQLVQIGTAATTIAFSNVTAGAHLIVNVCNPGSTAGAITWSGVIWPGGTVPTQSTTANVCDIWSFDATQATSTNAASFVIFGAASLNYP